MTTLDPPFGLPVAVAVLSACCVILIGAHVLGRPDGQPRLAAALVMVRLLVVLGLGLVLLNPVRARRKQTPYRPPVTILVDVSRSMSVRDVGQEDRLRAAVRLTAGNSRILQSFGQNLSFVAFAERVSPVSAAQLQAALPEGGRTDIAAALRYSEPLAANGGHVLLVSDGRDNAEGAPLEAARAIRLAGGTVHTLCLGSATPERNLKVAAHRSQVSGAPGQRMEISGEVRSSDLVPRAVVMDLMREGRRTGSTTVRLRGGRAEFTFEVREDRPGFHRYAVSARPLPDEAHRADNRAAVLVTISRDRAKLLLLEGRPSWDARFLADALRSDPGVQVDVIYKLTDARFYAVLGEDSKHQGIAVPRTVAEFGRYDVVVVGRGFEEFFDAEATAALKEWIAKRGGGLVFLRGRALERGDGMQELEPVTWSQAEIESLRLRLTEAGRQHPAFALGTSESAEVVVRQLPGLVSATRVVGEKALSVVLARGEATGSADREMAAIAYMRYGQGKTLAIAGQGLWRWAFLPPEQREIHGRVYQQFWSQTVRWLMSESDFLPGARASLRAERERYGPGERVILRGYLRDGGMQRPDSVTIVKPDGSRDRVVTAKGDAASADFLASYLPRESGDYLALLEPDTAAGVTQFRVEPGHEEDIHRSADPDLMRRIAEEGDGVVFTPAEVGNLATVVKRADAYRLRETRPRPVWDRAWLLAALMLLLVGEWALRRRAGLA